MTAEKAIDAEKLNLKTKVQKYLARIEQKNEELNALLDVFGDEAIEQAEVIEAKIAEGKAGKLAGYVLTIKNNIAIKGKPLTSASNMLRNYIAPYSATVVERLLAEDAIIIGTANMDEFAAGSESSTSAFGVVSNAINPEYVAGGSSGGSAVSVRAEFADASIASDTGGSIRCPAAFNNVVGFKPSYGSVSRYGLADMAMSLDQIGPIARTVKETRELYKVMRGIDHRDSTTTHFAPNDDIEEPRAAVVKEIVEASSDEVKEAFLSTLKRLPFKTEFISLPFAKDIVATYYLNMFAEFSSAMQKYDGVRYGAVDPTLLEGETFNEVAKKVRGALFGSEVKRRILLGTYITMKEFKDAWYLKALEARQHFIDEMDKLFQMYNTLLMPTMPTLPWKKGEKTEPLQIYMADASTALANLTALPAGTVPAGKPIRGFKIGVQVIGPYARDMHVLSVMEQIESVDKAKTI